MRVRRALARLCGRDARAPGSQNYPYKPVKGEGIRRLGFVLDFVWRTWLQPSGFPLSRE